MSILTSVLQYAYLLIIWWVAFLILAMTVDALRQKLGGPASYLCWEWTCTDVVIVLSGPITWTIVLTMCVRDDLKEYRRRQVHWTAPNAPARGFMRRLKAAERVGKPVPPPVMDTLAERLGRYAIEATEWERKLDETK